MNNNCSLHNIHSSCVPAAGDLFLVSYTCDSGGQERCIGTMGDDCLIFSRKPENQTQPLIKKVIETCNLIIFKNTPNPPLPKYLMAFDPLSRLLRLCMSVSSTWWEWFLKVCQSHSHRTPRRAMSVAWNVLWWRIFSTETGTCYQSGLWFVSPGSTRCY